MQNMQIELKQDCDKYDPRFIIVDDDGQIIDDAQGYGYKSRQKAAKAMWYKFKGGKTKINQKRREKNAFFKQYKDLAKFLNKIYENNFKEIARGEITDEDIIAEVKNKLLRFLLSIYLAPNNSKFGNQKKKLTPIPFPPSTQDGIIKHNAEEVHFCLFEIALIPLFPIQYNQ